MVGPLYGRRPTRQPTYRSQIDYSSPLARNVQFAFNAADYQATQDLGGKLITPFGAAFANATDNALQFAPNLAIQNADVVTVQALLYAPAAVSGGSPTRIFATRGTAQGDGNRRGWEMAMIGGTFVSVDLQALDSVGGRTDCLSGGTGYGNAGVSVVGKLLWVVAEITRNVGVNTAISTWMKTRDGPEDTGSGSTPTVFGDDNALVNRLEVGGLMAGTTTLTDYKVLQIIARPGTITQAERFAWYENPWGLFLPTAATMAALRFYADPGATILVQPQSQLVEAGASVTFSITAIGVLAYQWQDDSTGSFADISGETSSSITVSPAVEGRQYRVVLNAGALTSVVVRTDLARRGTLGEFDASMRVQGWF